jgi:predicted MFS family arabinose efflux permease
VTTLEGRATEQGTQGISRSLVAIMAVATGLTVANNYYAQPLLPVIEHSLHLSAGVAGLLVTVAQAGYAAGLVLLLPLGDLLERRRLISAMSLGLAAALLVLALSPDPAVLLVASLLVGALSVLAQILVPFAAGLATEANRGRVVGLVMSGLLLGILVARTLAGLVAEAGSWRTVYVVAAIAVLLQAAVLWRTLPNSHEDTGLRYPALLRTVLTLLRDEPLLRRRCLLGGLSFGCFSVLWTSMAFLLAAAPYRYNSAVIGLFGLVGAGGALAASVAGRLSDRGHSAALTIGSAVLLTACWLPTWLGRRHLAPLIVGILVLDLAAQGLHITNQSLVYRLAPQARSRINSAYMTSYFIGGAAGSALSAALYGTGGWSAVSLVGVGFGGLAVLVAIADRLRPIPANG